MTVLKNPWSFQGRMDFTDRITAAAYIQNWKEIKSRSGIRNTLIKNKLLNLTDFFKI